MLGDLKKGI